MIDLPPVALALASSAPAPLAAGVARVAGDLATRFGQTLGAFLDAGDAAADPSPSPSPWLPGTERQELAGDGKDVPADAPDSPDADPATAWLSGFAPPLPPPALPAPVPPAQTVSTPVSAASPARIAPDARGLTLTAAMLPPIQRPADAPDQRSFADVPGPGIGTPDPRPTAASDATPGPWNATPRPDAPMLALDIPVCAIGDAASPQPDAVIAAAAAAPVIDDTAVAGALSVASASTLQPVTGSAASAPDRPNPPGAYPPPPADATAADPRPAVPLSASSRQAIVPGAGPQPARHVFAAAIAAASSWRDRLGRNLPSDAATALTQPSTGVEPRSVPATDATHDAPIDLRDDHGLQQAIDRIATLRDDLRDETNASDTRIRLLPDRLGAVDIAVARRGDDLHVHFTAERAETRTLLIDAQPRLTELAAQRGMRITEASFATGAETSDGPKQDRPHVPQPRVPRAPAPADAADTPTQARLA